MKAGLLVVTVMVVYTLLLYFLLTSCHQYARGELRHVKCAPVTVRKVECPTSCGMVTVELGDTVVCPDGTIYLADP